MNAEVEPSIHEPVARRSGAPVTALGLTLERLRPLLTQPGVTELCINRPHEAFIESEGGWRCESLPFADYDWCRGVARLIANATRQRVDEQSPLLSAALPTGERVQVVMPPATLRDTVSLTFRRPADRVWSLRDLSERRVFARTAQASVELDAAERELTQLLRAGAYEAFLKRAVRARKNILVSGATGSGKTTLAKALMLEIPAHERLITIEDAPELNLDQHPNHVRLFHSRGDQGQARVSARQLVQACLRMRPDRILLAELRGEEALDYLRNCNSGHPGSITSIHAASAALAFRSNSRRVDGFPAHRYWPHC